MRILRLWFLLALSLAALSPRATAALILRYKMDGSGEQPETSGVSPAAPGVVQGSGHLFNTGPVPGGSYGLIRLPDGAIPQSVTLNGTTGDWVISTSPPSLTAPPTRVQNLLNNFTVMAWIKPTATSGIHRIFSTVGVNAAWGFGLNGVNVRFTDFGDYDTDSNTAPITANVWQHLAVVKSTSGIQFYVNGNLRYSDTTRTGNLNQATTTSTTWHLLNGSGSPEYFTGSVAEIRLYDTPLTPADILTAAGDNPTPSGVLNNDFNNVTNPFLNFSHGTKATATDTTLALFTNTQARTANKPADRIGNGSDDLWVGRTAADTGSVAFPAAGGTLTDWPASRIFHAWSGGRTGFLTTRLAVSTSGFYDLTATWKSLTQPGTKASVQVVKNGTAIFTGTIDGFLGSSLSTAAPVGVNRAAAFAQRGVTLTAGDFIDFVTSPNPASAAGNLAVDFRVVPVSGPPITTSTLVLSEFLASNKSILKDEDGQFGDWIEIYNGTGAPVELGGWALTDDGALPQKWVFPARTLAHGEYLVVFADGADDIKRPFYAPTSELHTNFQLSADGEYLGLVNPSGAVVDQVSPAFPSQLPDLAYGRAGTVGPVVGYLVPTPGKVNGQPAAGVPGKVTISVPSGRFTSGSPIAVQLTAPAAPGQTIRYTLDNSEPTATTGAVYNGTPLNISTTTILRTRAFVDGLKGLLSEATYLFVAANAQPSAADTYTLPVMVIDLLSTGAPTSTERATMVALFTPDGNGKTSLSNAPTVINRGSMHVRGQSSSGYQKKAFDLEFWDETNDDRRVQLLDLPANGDWTLYAPYDFDRVYFNNRLTYEMAARMGRFGPRTRYVELYVNPSGGPITSAHYQGIYVLADSVERDANRVDVTEMSPTDNTGDALTGGYIVSINKSDEAETILATGLPYMRNMFQNRSDIIPTGGMTTFLEYPKVGVVTNQQRTYIDNYLKLTEESIYGAGFKHPTTGLPYTEYIGRDTFIDYHIAQTVPQNVDALRLSTYFYKDRGGKLKAGPVWDADRALGSRDSRNNNPAIWDTNISTDKTEYFHYGWWHRLFQDPDFMQLWVDRYVQLRAPGGALNSAGSINPLIDQYVAEVAPIGSSVNAMTRDYARWPYDGTSGGLSGARQAYATEVATVRTWLQNRFNFMDGQILPTPTAVVAPDGLGGMQVTFTVPGATVNTQIYVTTDGSDPRLAGGNPNPNAVLLASGGSVTVSATSIVHFRQRNLTAPAFNSDSTATKMSRWSGFGETVVTVGAPVAVAGDVTISALHYHPANPNQSERDAGYLTDTPFEFLELVNIANHPVTLAGARFTEGIDFAFPATPLAQLAPGDRMLVVNNLAAFTLRYGAAAAARVIGEYGATDALDNGGETLTLLGSNGVTVLLSFSYKDSSPWPTAADGGGPALVLRAPESNPALGNGNNWRQSTVPGGTPGTTDRQTYAAWKTAHGISSDTQDGDSDGLSAALEYSLGTSPEAPSVTALPKISKLPNGDYALQFQRGLTADDARWELWTSAGLPTWQLTTATVLNRTVSGGVETITLSIPATSGRAFYQIRYTLP